MLIEYARLDELPTWSGDQDWLSDREREECGRWRSPMRRQTWIAGRWLAKKMIRQLLAPQSVQSANITVESVDPGGRSVRPCVMLHGIRRTDWCLSITHSNRAVLVALATTTGIRVGIDLCEQGSFPLSFTSTWFTQYEQQQLASGQRDLIARTWAAKESIYKACNRGEAFAPRRIEVSWDAESTVCRYGNYVFGDELELTTWDIDNQIAVSAVITDSEESETHLRTDPHLRECLS